VPPIAPGEQHTALMTRRGAQVVQASAKVDEAHGGGRKSRAGTVCPALRDALNGERLAQKTPMKSL
jgi:hypothetical protein